MASTRKDKHPIIKSHKCTRFSPGEDLCTGLSTPRISCNQCKFFAGPQPVSTSKSKRKDNRILMRNQSLIDVRSQLLHRSLVEEVNKRRLFKTVGAVENIGFQTPIEVPRKKSQPICGPSDVNTSRRGKGRGI